MKVSPIVLRNALAQYFNLGELHTLCFELGISYENLGGQGLEAKALSLVQYVQRHGLYELLVTAVQNARPHLDLGASPPTNTGTISSVSPTSGSSNSGSTYNFYGPVTGTAIGEGSVNAENIAGRDINITHNYAEPANKTEFAEQLAQLELLLKEAIAQGEIKDERDAATAVADIQDAISETQHEQPRASRISRRLEDVKEILESAGKASAAAIKAIPLISGLIKVVTTIF